MRQFAKSDPLCTVSLTITTESVITRIDPQVDVEVLDGAAVIHIKILFHFLAEHISQVIHPMGKILVSIYDTQVFCTNNDQDTSELESCQHEEADSRLMTTLRDVSHVCNQLIKCTCKQTCKGRCKNSEII